MHVRQSIALGCHLRAEGIGFGLFFAFPSLIKGGAKVVEGRSQPLNLEFRARLGSRSHALKPRTSPRCRIESNFKGFEAVNSDGALIGPWNPWLNYPKFGGPIWELVKVLSTSPTLPRPVREVAILVTGTRFHSGYELYAHVLIAEARGLPDSKIATIVAGQRPADLTREEVMAYDVASALVSGSVLPELVYRQAIATFGKDGVAELIYLIRALLSGIRDPEWL